MAYIRLHDLIDKVDWEDDNEVWEMSENDLDELCRNAITWISVKDRLPELDQDVLVYAVGKEDGFLDTTHIVISQRCISHIFPWDQGVEEWLAPWPYFNRNYEITHWMPLPSPPEED